MKRACLFLLAASLALAAHGQGVLKFGASAPVVRGFNGADDFTLTLTPSTYSGSGSGGTPTLSRDLNYSAGVSGASLYATFTLTTSGGGGANFPQAVTYTYSDSGAYVTPPNSNNGQATYAASGAGPYAVCVTGTHPVLSTKKVCTQVAKITGGSSNQWTSFRNTTVNTGDSKNSLTYDIQQGIYNAVSGKTHSASAVQLFASTPVPGGGAPALNTGCWCYGLVDLSGTPVYRYSQNLAAYTPSFSGMLVASQFSLFAWHTGNYGPQAGDVQTWRGTDGNLYTATVTSIGRVSGTDIGVAYYGTAVNSHVTRALLFEADTAPSSGSAYLPFMQGEGAGISNLPPGLPIIHGFNAGYEVLPLDLVAWGETGTASGTTYSGVVGWQANGESNLSAWSYSYYWQVYGIHPGDSGTPVVTVVPGSTQPILISTVWSVLYSPNYSLALSSIQAEMTALCSGCAQFSTTNLSGSGYSAY